MSKWEQLIAAREHLHLSQLEAAERLGIGVATYQRWESGRRKPQPRHMRELCEFFGLETGSNDTEPESGDQLTSARLEAGAEKRTDLSSPVPVSEKHREMRALLMTHLTARLWSLALGAHATCDEKRTAIRRAIEEFDSMNMNDANYQITRREAIGTLATLPLVTFGLVLPGKEIASTRHAEMLARSAASVEACWQLHEHGGASELLLGFQCTSRYMATLEDIYLTSAQHRQEALRLATQFALIKVLLGPHCAGTLATVPYAQEALALSQETGDLALQLSAYNKLAWTYWHEKDGRQALAIAQEAQAALERSLQQSDGEPLPDSIRGGIYSTLAMMLASRGQPFDIALGKAMERDPGTEVHAYLDFTRATMFLNAGWTYCSQDNYAQTMQMLEMRLDPETLVPRMPGVTDIGQVETMNLMAFTSLKAKDRDMERTIHFWQAAVEGAKALHSEMLFAQTTTTYEHLSIVWPGEARVQDLRDHLVRWKDA
jgi:transcriptional regulator with XRE-family HTH domain